MPETETTASDWGVTIFPGSNCDHDAIVTAEQVASQPPREIWHREDNIADLSAVILPGGFSYGDYLRGGAIARFAPVMDSIVEAASKGMLLIGICNGFQVLTESGLLPGALLKNRGLRFICRDIYLRVERTDTAFTSHYSDRQIIKLPIAHNEGNYHLDTEQLNQLEDNRQVVFRYCDAEGNVTKESCPNGSINNIAGIINSAGNILGMMPHPERRVDALLGVQDGLPLFESMHEHIERN